MVLFITLLASCHITDRGSTAAQDVNILSLKNVLVIRCCVTAQVPSCRILKWFLVQISLMPAEFDAELSCIRP